jgi:hypothetical protein
VATFMTRDSKEGALSEQPADIFVYGTKAEAVSEVQIQGADDVSDSQSTIKQKSLVFCIRNY